MFVKHELLPDLCIASGSLHYNRTFASLMNAKPVFQTAHKYWIEFSFTSCTCIKEFTQNDCWVSY